jgi:striatin 1/3/4
VWAIPPKEREPYAPYEPSLNLLRLEGHTDGVWDICLLGGTSPDKEVLASASADGTVKVWDVSPSRASEEGGDLKLSWTARGTDYTAEEEGGATTKGKLSPTSLALCQSDMTKLAVAYRDSLVRIFDTETGKLVLTLQSNEGYGKSSNLRRYIMALS